MKNQTRWVYSHPLYGETFSYKYCLELSSGGGTSSKKSPATDAGSGWKGKKRNGYKSVIDDGEFAEDAGGTSGTADTGADHASSSGGEVSAVADDALAEMMNRKRRRESDAKEILQKVRTDVSEQMETGLKVNHDLAAALGIGTTK